jgi:hypothetical protein
MVKKSDIFLDNAEKDFLTHRQESGKFRTDWFSGFVKFDYPSPGNHFAVHIFNFF